MADGRAATHATRRRSITLAALGSLALVFPVVVTSAAWVDQVGFTADAASSTFDIQGRFAFTEQWQDIGLPGDPDTFDDGFEIATPPITDVLPKHSYVGDVFLCNAGDVDGWIADATLEEITTSREGPSTDLQLVEPLSIRVENIDIGTVIPANSCTDFTEQNPPNDIEGIIHFTTIPDFTGQYGSTTRIVIKIWVESGPPDAPAAGGAAGGAAAGGGAVGPFIATTEAAWLDKGGASMSVTAVEEPPPPLAIAVLPGADTFFAGPPVWSGIEGEVNPTPTSACFRVDVRTTSETPAPWHIILETDQPPFNNSPPFTIFGFQGLLYTNDNPGYTFEPALDYELSGRYLMDPIRFTQNASETEGYVATACIERVPEPEWQPPGGESYTQRPELEFSRRLDGPCIVATVDGHQPYFVGFTVSFNWRTVLDDLLAAGEITSVEHVLWLTYTHWGGIPIGVVNARGATGTNFLVTLQGFTRESRSVSEIAPVSNGACAR